jgi:hypothetical protein
MLYPITNLKMNKLTTISRTQQVPMSVDTPAKVSTFFRTANEDILPIKANFALLFTLITLQSRKLPKMALAVIWASEETRDASARERKLNYSDRYEPIYDNGKVAYGKSSTFRKESASNFVLMSGDEMEEGSLQKPELPSKGKFSKCFELFLG